MQSQLYFCQGVRGRDTTAILREGVSKSHRRKLDCACSVYCVMVSYYILGEGRGTPGFAAGGEEVPSIQGSNKV